MTLCVPYLIPCTEEAVISLGHREILELNEFPYRFGRESRRKNPKQQKTGTDRRFSKKKPNNDFYLFDLGNRLNISREHFQIEWDGQNFYISDRGSTCGTIINNTHNLRDLPKGRFPLKNGDLIKLGTPKSLYIYRFSLNGE